MNHLFLSPHLDDAVYSCGGTLWTLAERGDVCTVLTICAGDPSTQLSGYAQSLHTRWGLPNPSDAVQMVETRREEDIEACQLLGVQAVHWEIGDCIYRSDQSRSELRWLYQSDEAIFGAVDSADQPLVTEIATHLRQSKAYEEGRTFVYLPLAIGNHVDHQLVRLAAEQAYPHSMLRYYADYPYIAQPGQLERLEGDIAWQSLVAFPLSSMAISQRIAAMSCYRSQFSTFWPDQAALEAEVIGLVNRNGGAERFWEGN